MEKRRLGNTDIYLTELGYGCASLWGKPGFTSDEEAMGLFRRAYEMGIRFFDTGSSYGTAEERLGQCLREVGAAARGGMVISTKCGTRVSDSGRYYHDWSVEWLKRSLDTSMERLGVDYIDMLQLHGPGADDISDAVLRWMHNLKSDGTVRAIGINSFDTDVLEHVCRGRLFDFIMLDYNILRQDREPLIDRLNENGIGVIAGAPLAQSLFSNRVYHMRGKRDVWYLLRALKNFRGHMRYGRRFRFINKLDGFSGSQLALRYVLDNPLVSSAVFGSVSINHLVENISATDICMPDAVRSRIQTAGRGVHGVLDRK